MAFTFNPYGTQAQTNDPYETYRQLRDDHPLYFNEEQRFWAITRFDDVMRAVKDTEIFSSAQGITILDRPDTPVYPMMIQMDPPRHTKLRALVSRAFTPRTVTEMEPRVRAITRELLGAMVSAGGGDIVRDLGAALPSMVIAEILGVPPADWPQFRKWSEDMVEISPDTDAQQRSAEGAINLYMYFTEMLNDRRTQPQDDMMTRLVEAEVDGERLTEDELVWFCMMLLIGGNGTTTNLISAGSWLLHDHPDQRAALIADASLIPAAVDEMLRFESPVQGMGRTITRDIEWDGHVLHEGDKALLLYGAANRDEREFPDAHRFDIHRHQERNLAFAHGIHYCLGASLARLEGRVAFEELLATIPEYEIVEPELTWNQLIPIRGLVSLRVNARSHSTAS